MNDEIFLYRSLKYKKKDLNQHHSPHNVLKNVKVVQKTIFGKNFLHSGQPHFKKNFLKKVDFSFPNFTFFEDFVTLSCLKTEAKNSNKVIISIIGI